MLDLFNIGQTTEERLTSLKEEIKTVQKSLGIDPSRAKLKLFYGNLENINSGVLIITSPPAAKFFEGPNDKLVANLLQVYKFDKFFITYYYLIHKTDINPKDIKSFGYYIRKLIDIVNPKLIVCMGEESQFCFFKRKFMIADFHGKEIGQHETIPIYAAYPINYYEERTKFEDRNYKEKIRDSDWGSIKARYEELIK